MILIGIILSCTSTKSVQPIEDNLVEEKVHSEASTTDNIVEKKIVSEAKVPEKNEGDAKILLDGKEVNVNWDDGDTFSVISTGAEKPIRARLNGFNTLESYGPVHQWGTWTEQELYLLAKQAGVFAAAKVWSCTDTKKGGGYNRILVDCPDLRKEILEVGLAHPFSIDGSAPAEDIASLQKAIDNSAGMWAKGAPTLLVTSLHSQDEKADKDAYNRVCDLRSGECKAETHTNVYEICEKVCVDNDSCMIYVPYSKRYGEQRAKCLQQ
jgi:micrococcal nuclease